jgi:PBP1b-binding outer membrane lipoprotein LpoB
MKTKKILSAITIIAMILSCAGLMSCENNEDKVAEVQKKYAELTQLCDDVTYLLEAMVYYGVEVNSADAANYNKGIDYINELGELQIDNMSIKDLDAILTELNQFVSEMKTLKAEGQSVVADLEELFGE